MKCVGILTALLWMGGGIASETSFQEPKESYFFEKDKTYYASILTSRGKIVCQLFPEKAPLSVTNFLQLIKGHFYEGIPFHRVIPGFVVQGGDPERIGSDALSYTLPPEMGLSHEMGSLAWARLPDILNPNRRSNGSQFYITLDKMPFLDGEYSVFGKVVDGLDVLKEISEEDKIDKVEVIIK